MSFTDDDLGDIATRLTRDATAAISLIAKLRPELESLLQRLEFAEKNLACTGVRNWLRTVRKDEQIIHNALARLRTHEEMAASGGLGGLTDEQLKDLAKPLLASRISIEQAHTKWNILKRCCASLTAINQVFQGSTKESRREQILTKERTGQISEDAGIDGKERQLLHRSLKAKAKVEVDVVDNGATWVDIRSLGLDRLARQMSDAGWAWGDYELGDDVDPEDWESVPLAASVKRLVEAARRNRYDYVVPRIRVILPRIGRGDNADVDIFLDQLTRMDTKYPVIIEDRESDFLKASSPASLDAALDRLVGDSLSGLTPTINVDHTILIDLISDITNFRLEPQSWQAATTRAQIEEEARHEGGLMARTLYPILANRRLLCTREAAIHFHDVLRTVGTPAERERGRLLVPWDGQPAGLTDEEIRDQFNALSCFPPPPNVQIPIKVLHTEWDGHTSLTRAVEDGKLPEVALEVARCGNFGSSKLSIYMQGWASGDITLTSNKEIRGQIRTWIEQHRRGDDDRGPRIWRVDVTRNLLAKSATPPVGWEGEVRNVRHR